MKLVRNFLEGIAGIQVFYIIGLLIFVTLFIVILIRTMRRPASEMNEFKRSILTDNSSEELNQ